MPDADFWTPLLSFIGTLSALAVTKTFEHVLVRKFEAQHLTRDALADLTSTLTSVEGALRGLLVAKSLDSYSNLANTSSGWDLSAPSIKLEKLLGPFDAEKIHRLAMLYHERHEHFVRLSKQHEDAYYWLLDHPEADWKEPQAGERVARIRVARQRMSNHSRDMLKFGYELAEQLMQRSERPGLPTLLRQATSEEFLREQLGLTNESIRLRRAFYSLIESPFVFDPALRYSFASWNDEIAGRLSALNGSLTLEIDYRDSQEHQRTGRFVIPPKLEVALPSSGTPRSGRVWWPGAKTPCELVTLPSSAEQLPNDGDDRGRITLGPDVYSTVSRLLPAGPQVTRLLPQ